MKAYYNLESLKEQNISYNHEHRVTQQDVNKVNRLIDIIEKRSHLEPGDIIKCVGTDKTYENGHIEYAGDWYPGAFHICTEPYSPFVAEAGGRLNIDTSGGYWIAEKDKNKFIRICKRNKRFKTWGHNGACGNGAVYFNAEVTAWEYHSDKIY